MPRLTALVLAVAMISPLRPAAAQGASRSPGDSLSPIQRLIWGLPLTFNHIQATASGPVTTGSPLGTVDTFPTVRSTGYQAEYEQAQDLYAQGRYFEAATMLRAPVAAEPDNWFLLMALGNALFRVDSLRPESKRVLTRLVSLIDATEQDTTALVIDLWFVDAYWKLGMLFLDDGNYGAALGQLIKVVIAPQPDPRHRAAVYAYVAEAFFHLGERADAQYYVDRTLELDPGNTYVLQFGARQAK